MNYFPKFVFLAGVLLLFLTGAARSFLSRAEKSLISPYTSYTHPVVPGLSARSKLPAVKAPQASSEVQLGQGFNAQKMPAQPAQNFSTEETTTAQQNFALSSGSRSPASVVLPSNGGASGGHESNVQELSAQSVQSFPTENATASKPNSGPSAGSKSPASAASPAKPAASQELESTMLEASTPAAPNLLSQAVMQIVISVILLLSCLFVILSKRYPSSDKHWAYATIGTILGFWLPK